MEMEVWRRAARRRDRYNPAYLHVLVIPEHCDVSALGGYPTAMSAGKSATNLGNICSETVNERLDIQPGCALSFGDRVGQQFADRLGDRLTAFSCHGIKGDRHRAVDAYGQVALTAFARCSSGTYGMLWPAFFSSHWIALGFAISRLHGCARVPG